ncbi:MAG: hypothetical protein DYG98_16805 [Haliscomenobacteraceae bacterium CHB4]|nr:hypothetical protein [Saprospiraceae bacterium]MCE7924710.1 hypothetical protein [Haliscomenobacteraceae bacterium CHB4]
MNALSGTRQLWTCPNCGRQFERQRQSHSCRPFALEQHFIGKETGRLLYEALREALEKQIGSFKIESLECCIHFVRTSTFAAVKILKDKIRVDFALNRGIESERFHQSVQMSAHRYLYDIDIMKETEIDKELIEWIQEAYNKK